MPTWIGPLMPIAVLMVLAAVLLGFGYAKYGGPDVRRIDGGLEKLAVPIGLLSGLLLIPHPVKGLSPVGFWVLTIGYFTVMTSVLVRFGGAARTVFVRSIWFFGCALLPSAGVLAFDDRRAAIVSLSGCMLLAMWAAILGWATSPNTTMRRPHAVAIMGFLVVLAVCSSVACWMV